MTRLLYFGMAGPFSIPPLARLLAADVPVSGVILPTAQPQPAVSPRQLEPPPAVSDLPLANPYLDHSIVQIAWTHQLPVWEVGSLHNEATLSLLAGLQPELVVVACFSRRFPPALLDLPRHGCLNLHPSLLPAYRGPAPLFWLARQAERRTGVTLHFLDTGLDTGDIVSQRAFERPLGQSGAMLEQRGAEVGAELLLAALAQLETGPLPRRPQSEAEASYFPWPTPADLKIPTAWPAERAFSFLRGAEQWPLQIVVGPERFTVRTALSWEPQGRLDRTYQRQGDELAVQFRPGVVRVRL